MPTFEEALQNARNLFVKNTGQYLNLKLDGTWASLLTVGLAMQQYHGIYKKGVAAGKLNQEKFVKEVAVQCAAYVSSIFIAAVQAKLAANKDGHLVLIVNGVTIPISELLSEEVRTGKPNSLMLIKQIDDITEKNQQPEAVDAGNLEDEARKAAGVAVQDVRVMLKIELNYSRDSLAHVDRALQRLKAMAEISPENKSNLVRASAEKYGAYIGEVMVRQMSGKWGKLRVRDTVMNAVTIGSTSAMPSLIVEAVLEGKSLSMGDSSAANVMEFVAKAEQRSKTSTTAGLFQNLDTPGEVPKRIPQFVQEAQRIAKVNYKIELDGTLFSLAALDEVIAKERQRLESERSVLNDENFSRARAFSVLPLGIYLGEVILSAHKGSWEEVPGKSWMRVRQNMIKLDPITVVSAFLRGETATATDKLNVATAQQYYQGVRPMLADVVEAKLCGPGRSKEQVLPEMGRDLELNRTMLHFAEACVVFSYSSRGIELDFSEKSLKDVDAILEEFHKNRDAALAASRVSAQDLVNWFGCYSGEVFRRAVGGEWVNDASSPVVAGGQKIVHLNVNGNRIFIVNKVRKFLDNGIGESVAFMLQASRSIINKQITPVPTS